MLSLLLALTDPSAPIVDASRLREGRECHVVVVEREDDSPRLIYSSQTIERVVHDARPALRVESVQLAGSTLIDTYLLDPETLQPMTYVSTVDGEQQVNVNYGEDRIFGTVVGRDGTHRSIDVQRVGSLWDGTLYGPLIASLPLAAGAHFEVPVWHYDAGMGRLVVDVTGRRRINTPNGPAEAWAVQVSPRAGVSAEYYIDVSNFAELGYRAGRFIQSPVSCDAAPGLTPIPTGKDWRRESQ